LAIGTWLAGEGLKQQHRRAEKQGLKKAKMKIALLEPSL